MIDSVFLYQSSILLYIIFLIYFLKRKKKLPTLFFSTLMYFYVVAVISVTLFPFPLEKLAVENVSKYNFLDNNFFPFHFISQSIETLSYDPRTPYIPFHSSLKIVLRQVGGNILLGVPFGFLAPLVWSKRNTFFKVVGTGFLFSLGIEACQFLLSLFVGYTYRVIDVDDIILNTLGCILGYMIFNVSMFLSKKHFLRPS